MDLISRSFRVERGSSLNNRISRSNSSLLASELVSTEITRVIAYQRLSASMRLTHHQSGSCRRRRNRAWSFLTKVFAFKNTGGNDLIARQAAETASKPLQAAAAEEEKKKRRQQSSWLPDPNRRWPVQGW